ncbi:hypothetical protein SL054_001277 [Flavobacterium psychrophilum]|uniref:DUF6037 family protein n=1 Tax=Flavobacterium psychrophilum TaxID=96345 RepID=UPI001C8F97F8|nr:DUF6037 family protein [Flavobacterium psychrophilum]EKT3972901.1 hypothetical protein [Flavobacterium psychrophilum]EKT4499568.1 hypothetical protein [Flavobacterium psychrophilum]EKT4519244.1 hypothetical protein [Flavobacterium psychrophilum]EKT4535628.1 hypothetical protein [Flavobacterium psychrophilum]EKT4569980.1 hypothetical protein [Flavobacterium psychrophilum]
MKLSNLEQIYSGIKSENETYFIFPFVKNGIKFDVLFDIFKTPFQLHFLLKSSNLSFKVIVEKGFEIKPNLDKADYKNLCNVLGLKYDANNPFKPHLFFQEFNNAIPNYNKRVVKNQELLPFYKLDIEENDKLFFDGFIEWNKLKNGKKVSEKNLEKTRILYSEHFDYCKRENVSIRYTTEKL